MLATYVQQSTFRRKNQRSVAFAEERAQRSIRDVAMSESFRRV